MEFRFEIYERVKVVNSEEQYATYWEAYGKLMRGCVAGAWGNSFIVGAHLNDKDLENAVFQIIARDRIDTSCGERNLYLITSQSDYDALESRKVGEKREPAEIFVIGEDGLETETTKKNYRIHFFPISRKAKIINIICVPAEIECESVSKIEIDEDKRETFGFSFHESDYYVTYAVASSEKEAAAHAAKVFGEYFQAKAEKFLQFAKEVKEVLDCL